MRRNNTESPATGNDQYIFTALRTGKLRIAFANNSNNQYKYTFNGSAANPSLGEYAPGVDLPLTDNTIYRLTVSLGNGALKVWLDDVGGTDYSDATPVFTDTTTLPTGYNWHLPPSGAVPSSGSLAGRQTRDMDIGIREFGTTNNTINNFGGTLRNGDWVDDVSIYNGIYTPQEISAEVAPLPGDYNGNGTVDAADYVVWRQTLGQSVSSSGSGADGDGDGTIDTGDFDIWRAHFGQTAGSGAGAMANAAVPEPATVLLLMFAAAGSCLRRGRPT